MTCPWGQLSATGAEGERAAGRRVAGPGVRMARLETGPLAFTAFSLCFPGHAL